MYSLSGRYLLIGGRVAVHSLSGGNKLGAWRNELHSLCRRQVRLESGKRSLCGLPGGILRGVHRCSGMLALLVRQVLRREWSVNVRPLRSRFVQLARKQSVPTVSRRNVLRSWKRRLHSVQPRHVHSDRRRKLLHHLPSRHLPPAGRRHSVHSLSVREHLRDGRRLVHGLSGRDDGQRLANRM